jgi:hypothetical protein
MRQVAQKFALTVLIFNTLAELPPLGFGAKGTIPNLLRLVTVSNRDRRNLSGK